MDSKGGSSKWISDLVSVDHSSFFFGKQVFFCGMDVGRGQMFGHNVGRFYGDLRGLRGQLTIVGVSRTLTKASDKQVRSRARIAAEYRSVERGIWWAGAGYLFGLCAPAGSRRAGSETFERLQALRTVAG